MKQVLEKSASQKSKKKTVSSAGPRMRRIVVGISGASGVIYGVRLLEVLKELNVETHLVLTPPAKVTIAAETDLSVAEVEKLATRVYRYNDIAATIASGSFQVDAMVIIPCSMHTLGALASGFADNLLLRAAEVTLKERRPLIVVPRETPMTLIHLENMEKIAEGRSDSSARDASVLSASQDTRRHHKSSRWESPGSAASRK